MIIHHAQILIEQLTEIEQRIQEMEKYFDVGELEELREAILIAALKKRKAQIGPFLKKFS